jgi:hypothetical protein
LGYDPFSETAREKVLVLIAWQDDVLNGRLEWRDRQGEWGGEQGFPAAASDCGRLARAMAFALAVQIQIIASTRADPQDGDATAPPPPVAHATAEPVKPAPAPPAPPVAVQIASPAPVAAPGPRPLFAIGAGSAVGAGMAASPIVWGRIFGTVAWPHLSLELAGAASVPETTRRADNAGVWQQYLFAQAAGCAVLSRWRACALSNVGEVRMRGEDIDRPATAAVPLVALGLRAGLLQPLGQHLFLQAHLDGVANLNRWTASLDRVAVWGAPRFAASLGLDLGVRLR